LGSPRQQQHPGKERFARKMAGEKRLITTDVIFSLAGNAGK